MRYTYLLVDFCAMLIPLVFTFHPKIRFEKYWHSIFVSCTLTGTLFVAWDVWFTQMNVWSFNPKYVMGIYVFGLPVEEVLFFICIPYSCLFTYYCLDKFFILQWNAKTESTFCLLLVFSLTLLGIVFIKKWYTSVSFLSAAAAIFLSKFVVKADWLGKYLTVYGMLLLPFFIVNGILTGTGPAEPVVNYNDAENMNLRLLTIPVEDIIYGFEMILLNVFVFEMMRKETFHKQITKGVVL